MMDPTFSKYPKTRPPLTPAHQAVYERAYKENRAGATAASSLSQRMERWMHRAVALDASESKTTLELGAGTLNQLPFEPMSAAYDVIEPTAFFLEASSSRARVRNIYPRIEDVPAGNRYDRITSCAVLEHICDLPDLVARSALLLKPDGSFRNAIPSEGGFLWYFARMMTTGLEFRLRYNLDYMVLMRHEHVNTAREIETAISVFFDDVKIRSFGVGRQLSFYRFIEARRPRLDAARSWIAGRDRHKPAA